MTGIESPQANLSRKPVESAADLAFVQAIAPSGDKKVRELSSECMVSVTGVSKHDLLRGGMDWYQARLSEFATDNDQDAFDQLYILDFQVEDLTDPKPSHRQEAQQTIVS